MQLKSDNISGQTRQALENVKSLLEASNTSLEHVVKTTIMLVRMDDFSSVNKIYSEFFTHQPPARSTFAVAGLPMGALIEIECVAIVPPIPPGTRTCVIL